MTDILIKLSQTISQRKQHSSEESYTASLIRSGIEKCSKKFGEESFELVIAALNEDLDSFNNEAADVLFHLLVLIESKNADFNEILSILEKRKNISGHAEKASRKKDSF
ncbi:MAG: phosphoribosyl-ATP diphosphatase [Paracoccaceae bacterium]|nr:phosphoribosyl-ATP diphosphatase [Paracoccaceae bacterium]